MTRKKWLRLKRTRPELFAGLEFAAWETMTNPELRNMRSYSPREVISRLTAWRLVHYQDPDSKYFRTM